MHTQSLLEKSQRIGKLAEKSLTPPGTEILVTTFTSIACCTSRDRQHMNFLTVEKYLFLLCLSKLRDLLIIIFSLQLI